jgi:hypothetical protein
MFALEMAVPGKKTSLITKKKAGDICVGDSCDSKKAALISKKIAGNNCVGDSCA